MQELHTKQKTNLTEMHNIFVRKNILYKLLVLLLLPLFQVEAQQHTSTKRDTVGTEVVTVIETQIKEEEGIRFFFRLDISEFDPHFSSNYEQLKRLDELISDKNALVGLDSLVLYAAASIDGRYINNERLAKARAATIKRMMIERYPSIKPEFIRTRHVAEEWEGLRRAIVEDPHVPYRKELIALIDGKREADNKEWVIKNLHNKVPWDYLRLHILPRQRYGASVVFHYNIERQRLIESLEKPEPIQIHYTDTVRLEDVIVKRDTVYYTDTLLIKGISRERFYKLMKEAAEKGEPLRYKNKEYKDIRIVE